MITVTTEDEQCQKGTICHKSSHKNNSTTIIILSQKPSSIVHCATKNYSHKKSLNLNQKIRLNITEYFLDDKQKILSIVKVTF